MFRYGSSVARGPMLLLIAGLAALAGLAAGGAAAATPAQEPASGGTSRVSVGPAGAQANGVSSSQAISADGRYVAFETSASNLVVGDTNQIRDVVVRDRAAHVTRRVSVGPGGAQANGSSHRPAVSAHGRYVAFSSFASNLVPGDTNGSFDVFVRDQLTHQTRRVSVGPGGAQANSYSDNPAISAHGRYVAFSSFASNLVPGDTNGTFDLFVWDRTTQVTRRVSVGPGGAQANDSSFAPVVSADGRYVAFYSWASNLVPGDTNGTGDVFVRDLRAGGETRRVSIGPGGAQANDFSYDPAISADGEHVAFTSDASNLVAGDTNGTADVFVWGGLAQVTRRVSIGPGGAQARDASFAPAVSAQGRHVAFYSWAPNLVTGDTNDTTDVFVWDRRVHATRRVSVSADGAQANDSSFSPAISAHGRHVAFDSWASNLVSGDTNDTADVFVRSSPVG